MTEPSFFSFPLRPSTTRKTFSPSFPIGRAVLPNMTSASLLLFLPSFLGGQHPGFEMTAMGSSRRFFFSSPSPTSSRRASGWLLFSFSCHFLEGFGNPFFSFPRRYLSLSSSLFFLPFSPLLSLFLSGGSESLFFRTARRSPFFLHPFWAREEAQEPLLSSSSWMLAAEPMEEIAPFLSFSFLAGSKARLISPRLWESSFSILPFLFFPFPPLWP